MSSYISASDESKFESSALGTKEHWDAQYKTELKNFGEIGDIGEVWFGEQSVERIARWVEKQEIPEDARILDLGCGNGATLLALYERGYKNLVGVDYSETAIDLARVVAQKEGCDILYEVADLLQSPTASGQPSCLSEEFDLCIDKGTYDAISLHPDNSEEKRSAYKRTVEQLTKPGGLLLVTSCNWTETELQNFFVGEKITLHSIIPTPKIQFGGSQGSSTSVVVFTRV